MILLEDVSTVYEGESVPTITSINLTVPAGEFITIVGPNGAGKTTLLETVNGLLHFAGNICVFGMDLRTHGTQIRKRIGYVPQEFTVDRLTPFLVKDVVLMGRYGNIGLFKSPTEKDHQVVEKTMELFSILDLVNRPVGKLSGGQLQKVMIARALAAEPDIILLDEPFSNLDLESKNIVSEKISNFSSKGLTVLMVVHDTSSIPASCNRIITMQQGTIVSDKKRGYCSD